MGAKLTAFYAKVKAEKGVQGLVKLAMMTRMSDKVAATAEDSPENIKKFEEAVAKILS